jgi:group I intron endonuclease
MKSGIYLIKNTVNNKVYVGSAINISNRWSRHKHDLKEGKHHSEHLQKSWDKYGEQSFTFEILEEVTNPEHLLAYEQVYLDYYKSFEVDRGYNMCKVAGSHLGMKRKEETIKKLKNRIISQETKHKLSEAQKGRIFSEETKKKIGEANSGRKRTEETKTKMSEAKKGKKRSEETKKKISETKRTLAKKQEKN